MLARFLRARALLSQFTIAIRFAKAGAISTAKKSSISKIRSGKVLPAVTDKKSRPMALERKKEQRAKKSLLLATRKERLKAKREKLKQQRAKKRLLLAKRKEAIKAKRQREIALALKRREQLANIKSQASMKKQRSKLLDKPWQGKGTLCTQPALLYVSEKMKTYQRSADESALTAVQKFRKEYVALSTEQKAPYEATAAANRTARAGAKAKVKGILMGPYSLFMKENYHSVSSSLPGADGSAKMPLIAKEISRRWKALSTEQKAAYKVKADATRADAQKNLDQLMQSK